MITYLEISHAEGDFWWSGNIGIDSMSSFQRINVNDSLSLQLGNDTYNFIVDSKHIDRQGGKAPRLTVALISPSAVFSSPRYRPAEFIWNNPVYAHTAANESFGGTIAWDLVDWQLRAGQLAFSNSSPIIVIDSLVKVVGGVVETLPDGTLHTRHSFPVPVSNWSSATPDHILTDSEDLLSSNESYINRLQFNKVLVRGYTPRDTGFIEVEVNPYMGGKKFYTGDQIPLLVYTGRNVNSVEAVTSSGYIIQTGFTSQMLRQQKVTFSNKNYTTIDKPATSIQTVQWIGNSLGNLTLEDDSVTLTAQNAGVAVALVTYYSQAFFFNWVTPNIDTRNVVTLDVSSTGVVNLRYGMTSVPFVAHFRGISNQINASADEIFCQRGEGEFRGPDINEPKLTSMGAKLSRGRFEIDSNSNLQIVLIECTYRSGFRLGQLIEIHDAAMGTSWIGKLTSISHTSNGVKTTSKLEILRSV